MHGTLPLPADTFDLHTYSTAPPPSSAPPESTSSTTVPPSSALQETNAPSIFQTSHHTMEISVELPIRHPVNPAFQPEANKQSKTADGAEIQPATDAHEVHIAGNPFPRLNNSLAEVGQEPADLDTRNPSAPSASTKSASAPDQRVNLEARLRQFEDAEGEFPYIPSMRRGIYASPHLLPLSAPSTPITHLSSHLGCMDPHSPSFLQRISADWETREQETV